MKEAGGAFDPQGPMAEEIARVWWILLILGTIVFLAVTAYMIVGLVRRDRSDEPTEDDSLLPNRWIVGGGVVVPTIMVAAVFGVSMASMSVLDTDVPDDTVVIEVTGNQWWWEVSYEGHDFETANEIHIPVNRPVLLRLMSDDVIHSFWVPQLAGKIDALPDHPNELVIEANEVGQYGGSCAEFCGLQHANMAVLVVAERQEDFEDWLEEQSTDAAIANSGEVADGAEAFLSSRCIECHTIKGTFADGEKGPDLTHVASRRYLGATTLTNTPENLRRWVGEPQKIKPGNKMPDIELTEDELDAITAFLGSLR